MIERQVGAADAAMHYLSRRPKAEVHQGFALARPPVIRLLLVIQVPHARDKSSVALLSCPIDGFQGGEDVLRGLLRQQAHASDV